MKPTDVVDPIRRGDRRCAEQAREREAGTYAVVARKVAASP